MKNINQKLQLYHSIRISHKNYDIERANKMRDDLIKELNVDMIKFQKMYFEYVKSIVDRCKR